MERVDRTLDTSGRPMAEHDPSHRFAALGSLILSQAPEGLAHRHRPGSLEQINQ